MEFVRGLCRGDAKLAGSDFMSTLGRFAQWYRDDIATANAKLAGK